MTPEWFLPHIVDPALAFLTSVAGTPSDDRARVLVMTIAGQETNWRFRRQIGGPARSYWQDEEGGAVVGLFNLVPTQLRAVCSALDIPYDQDTVFEAMAWNDMLAGCMARLLLWTDPAALPAVGDVQGGWVYYLRLWRPGAPRPAAWPALYATSLALVRPS